MDRRPGAASIGGNPSRFPAPFLLPSALTAPAVVRFAAWMVFLMAAPLLLRAEAPPAPAPIGQLVQIESTINSETFTRISRTALNLKQRGEQMGTQPVLILQIQDGISRYGDVRELAKFLSSDIPQVRTIAWIPKDLRGINGMLALACHEIVMAPTAGFGDLGRGAPVDPDMQAFILGLVGQRRNPLLSDPLVLGMIDRQKEVLWVRIKTGEGEKATHESKLVLTPEFEQLMQAKAVIEDRRTLKAAGSDGMFLGATCRDLNILTANVFEDERQMLAHYRLGSDTLKEQFTAGNDLKVAMIRIHGVIDTMYEEYLHRQIQRQISGGVNMLIFEVDSPGGMLEPCVRLAGIFADCADDKVRTIAYIPRQAISGGAIVSFGCDEIYLHSDALIGDAQPIEVRPGEAFNKVPEKIVSKLAQDMRIIAERKKRSVALLQAMVDKDLEVFRAVNRRDGRVQFMSELEISQNPDEWEKGALVPESKAGMILTVTGQRAHDLGLAEEPVNSFEDLKQRLHIPIETKLVPLAPKFVDKLVFFLNTPFITGLLLFLGIVCIYMEMHIPSGLFAIGGVLCFALFFWSRFLGGTAGWLEVILFLIGISCLALEIFVLPGFGVFGVSGGLLVVASLILAGQTFFVPITSQDYTELSRSLNTLMLSGVVFAVVAFSLSQFLPRSRLWDHMVLTPPGAKPSRAADEPRLSPEALGQKIEHALLGARGESVSVLRPAGKARFGENFVDVVSDGGFIDQGTPIEVVAVDGMRIVVRRLA